MLKNISIECGKTLYSDEIEKYINNYDENFILDVDEAIFMCTDNDNSKYHESSSIRFTRINTFRKQELGDDVRGYKISVYVDDYQVSNTFPGTIIINLKTNKINIYDRYKKKCNKYITDRYGFDDPYYNTWITKFVKL